MKLPATYFCLFVFLIGPGIVGYAQQESADLESEKTKPEKSEAKKDDSEEASENVKKSAIVAKPVAKQLYVVQSGDNMWKIAKAHGVEMRALLHENKLENSNSLQIGDVLTLPKDVKSQNPPAPEEENPDAKVAGTGEVNPEESAHSGEGGWELYTIKSGDNPWKIAKAHGLDHQAIVKLNPGMDFTKLRIGQEIKVPKK